MTVTIPAEAQSIIDRLAAVDLQRPVCDQARVEAALGRHFHALGVEPLPIRWVRDAETAYVDVFRTARSTAWFAARSTARSTAWSAVRSAARSTAWSAVRSAAESAAESAAWSAAESAAWSAAESAAWSAAEFAAESAAWSAAEFAAESAAWSAAEFAAESAAIDRAIGIWLPFLDAFEAGLWLFFPTATALIAVPRPVLQLAGEQLHCADGPAVHWPDGARYYFWRGVQVRDDVILHPEHITVPKIDGERNAEVRRVLVERYGLQRFLLDGGAAVKDRDETGTLYQRDLGDDEPIVMVQVTNSTPEPDGTRKRYFIRVPPDIKTVREALAWSFGLRADAYAPQRET